MINLEYISEDKYDKLLKERQEQLKDIEQDIEKLKAAITVRNIYVEEHRKTPKNGDVFKIPCGELYIVRFINGRFISMNEYGEEIDNTTGYKEHFPDSGWNRIGNVFEDYKDK